MATTSMSIVRLVLVMPIQHPGGDRTLTAAALALKTQPLGSPNKEDVLPEFEIADDTYVDSRESKSRLERELTLKAFSENDIRAGLSV